MLQKQNCCLFSLFVVLLGFATLPYIAIFLKIPYFIYDFLKFGKKGKKMSIKKFIIKTTKNKKSIDKDNFIIYNVTSIMANYLAKVSLAINFSR